MINRLTTYILFQFLFEQRLNTFFIITSNFHLFYQPLTLFYLQKFENNSIVLRNTDLFTGKSKLPRSLISVEAIIKETVFTNKVIFFFPCVGFEKDARLINEYLNDFDLMIEIPQAITRRGFKLKKRQKFFKYCPSLIIYTDSIENRYLIFNIKNLDIPCIGLVDSTNVTRPFDVNIRVPRVNNYFKIYYFIFLFKLIAHYKKLHMRLSIFNYINLRINYLKKLALLK